jgi:hypothetical protein
MTAKTTYSSWKNDHVWGQFIEETGLMVRADNETGKATFWRGRSTEEKTN